jgi:hypothetical protein
MDDRGEVMEYRDATVADALLLAEMNHQLIHDEGYSNRAQKKSRPRDLNPEPRLYESRALPLS